MLALANNWNPSSPESTHFQANWCQSPSETYWTSLLWQVFGPTSRPFLLSFVERDLSHTLWPPFPPPDFGACQRRGSGERGVTGHAAALGGAQQQHLSRSLGVAAPRRRDLSATRVAVVKNQNETIWGQPQVLALGSMYQGSTLGTYRG